MVDSSARLQKYYASAPAGEIAREGLSLFHSAFSQTWHFTNFPVEFSANVRGGSVDFLTHPFRFREPDSSTTGKIEVLVDIFNSGPDFIAELQAAAADASDRIEMEYNVYLEAGAGAERTILLDVQAVSPSQSSGSATIRAVGANVLNSQYPRKYYRTSKFPGLRR
ncbi:MAG: DUF1833 domain-containing protein [Alphaproteobacteria bacterium]|nr:hypothetical protein [Hyphomonas sp.]MBR9807453.1 DUF1833 domain-containing protein [Alphaproteobacteria bacterium]|tara:strand:+ start:93 stop:590 length:498 start_codon:yes stop_codon:yes gene_type:complete